MPNNLTDYEECRLLDLSMLNTDLVLLMAVASTDAAAGTEVAGGSYSRQTLHCGAAATVSGVSSKANDTTIAFTGLPTTDIQGWELRDSGGTNRKWHGLIARQLGTAQATGDTVSVTAHGYNDGDKVVFQSGYAPAGLTANTTYFVRDKTTNTFKVATTLGGSAIDITADLATVVVGKVVSVTAGDGYALTAGQIANSLS